MCAKKHLNIIRERCVVVVVVVCVGYAASAVNKAENSAFVSQRVYCMCVLMRRAWVQKGESGWVRGRKCRAQRVWVGTLFSTERSPLFSRACLPRHRSYQATLYGLNGLAGKAAPHYPPPLLCSHPEHVCFLQLPPLSHSAYPTPPKNISTSSFPSVFSFLLIPFYVLPVVSFSFLRVILLHNDLLLSLLSHFLSHDALTILWSLSVHPLN